jgi:ribosome-associated protein
MQEFHLKEGEEFIPLIQLLKVVSIAMSGGEAQLMVTDGLVKVNKEVELRKRAKIRSGYVVEVMGKTVKVV